MGQLPQDTAPTDGNDVPKNEPPDNEPSDHEPLDLEDTGTSAPARMDGTGPGPQPLMRTMVESLLAASDGQEDADGYLPDGLADIFVKKQLADPHVQSLLRVLDPVDCKKLAEELREFADGLGASPPGR